MLAMLTAVCLKISEEYHSEYLSPVGVVLSVW